MSTQSRLESVVKSEDLLRWISWDFCFCVLRIEHKFCVNLLNVRSLILKEWSTRKAKQKCFRDSPHFFKQGKNRDFWIFPYFLFSGKKTGKNRALSSLFALNLAQKALIFLLPEKRKFTFIKIKPKRNLINLKRAFRWLLIGATRFWQHQVDHAYSKPVVIIDDSDPLQQSQVKSTTQSKMPQTFRQSSLRRTTTK